MTDIEAQIPIPLYECKLCGGIYQDIVTECDCTIGESFTYNELCAYRQKHQTERELVFCNAKLDMTREILELVLTDAEMMPPLDSDTAVVFPDTIEAVRKTLQLLK